MVDVQECSADPHAIAGGPRRWRSSRGRVGRGRHGIATVGDAQAPGSPPCSGHVRSRPHLRPGCCALEARPPHPQGARGGGDGGNTRGEALTATPEPWIQACGSHHVTWSRGLGHLPQTWPPWRRWLVAGVCRIPAAHGPYGVHVQELSSLTSGSCQNL